MHRKKLSKLLYPFLSNWSISDVKQYHERATLSRIGFGWLAL